MTTYIKVRDGDMLIDVTYKIYIINIFITQKDKVLTFDCRVKSISTRLFITEPALYALHHL